MKRATGKLSNKVEVVNSVAIIIELNNLNIRKMIKKNKDKTY